MRKSLLYAMLLSVVSIPLAAQVLPPECDTVDPLPDPYVFILLDTSGSMNNAVECTQAEYDAGDCSYVCLDSSPTDECFAPLRGDQPGGKWVQVRQALHEVMAERDGILYGFATFPNQDALAVFNRHWLYKATVAGPSIPGWGAFPALNAQEAFGSTWNCTSGTNIGCTAAAPADLPDVWELTRVKQLAKGGNPLAQSSNFYVRTAASVIYRVQYSTPTGGPLGSPLQNTVTIRRCNDSTCASQTLVASKAVTWEPVSEYLSWDNYAGTSSRSEPYAFYLQADAADAISANSCTGWEPNTDSAADAFTYSSLSYNLKQPTDASDPRGSFFTVGDVIPFDWNASHKEDLLARIAPNLAVDPLAVPDFLTSLQFQAQKLPGEPILRLQDESVRPLIAHGSSPLGNAVRDFRTWYTGWAAVAAAQDPDWTCRLKHLLVIVDDGGGTCPGANPCSEAFYLRRDHGLRTSTLFLGAPFLSCLAQNGDGASFVPDTRQEIEDSLRDFFDVVVTSF